MKFSIITITFNRAELIEQTIKSVLMQSYQNFEMIIVDDGSTDHTAEVIEKYKAIYTTKIKYIKCHKIGKPSALRNIGIKNTSGDIISILDSDDLWVKNKLEHMFNIFSNFPKVEFAFHNLQHFYKEKEPLPAYYIYKNSFYSNILERVLNGTILAFPVCSIRKTLIDKIGLFDEDAIEGLLEYYIKAASYGKVYYLNKPLTLMRRHDNNLTKNFDIIHCLDAITTFNKLKTDKILTKEQYKKASNFLNYKIALYYLKHNNPTEAHKFLYPIIKHSSILINSI